MHIRVHTHKSLTLKLNKYKKNRELFITPVGVILLSQLCVSVCERVLAHAKLNPYLSLPLNKVRQSFYSQIIKPHVMTKVRFSEIPEDSPIVKKTRKTSKKTFSSDDDSSSVDNYFDDNFPNIDKEKSYFKTMINFPDFGITLDLFHIRSIEKTFRITESNYGTGMIKNEYGISINRNITSSPSCLKTDIELWFDKEEIRDQRYEKIMTALDTAGIRVMKI